MLSDRAMLGDTTVYAFCQCDKNKTDIAINDYKGLRYIQIR